MLSFAFVYFIMRFKFLPLRPTSALQIHRIAARFTADRSRHFPDCRVIRPNGRVRNPLRHEDYARFVLTRRLQFASLLVPWHNTQNRGILSNLLYRL